MRVRGRWVGWRNHWVFPPTVPPGFVISFATGRWEPDTTAVVAQTLSAGDVFVDVGANVGYFSRLAAERVGESGAVFAFEPEPTNFDALVRNTQKYPQVYAIPAAVARRNGLQTLFLSDLAGCHSLAVPGRRFRWVPILTFDTLVEAAALKTVHLAKIDAEGCEPDVLDGMRDSLASGIVRALILEYAPQLVGAGGADPQLAVRQLLPRYEIRVIERSKYSWPATPLTNDSLDDLTRTLCRAADPTVCVNLMAVIRAG